MRVKSLSSPPDEQEAFALALGELLERRLKGPAISTAEMESRIDAMIERKRLSLSKQ